jgi:hypothetical protein
MSTLVLLVVGAAWLAVLVPPMVRSRINGSPSNSVTNFRRQLDSLESVGGRSQGQLRGMARPLAPSARPARQHGTLSNVTGALVRPSGTRNHQPLGALSHSEYVRQRRQNLVVGMGVTVLLSLFLALTTGSQIFFTVFAVSLVSLAVYCYVLVQLRIRRDRERYLTRNSRHR